MGRHPCQLALGKPYRAAASDQAEDRFDGGGLASAVAAEKSHNSPHRDLEAHPLENVRLAKVDVKVFDLEQGACDSWSAHTLSGPRYASWTTCSAITFDGVSIRSNLP